MPGTIAARLAELGIVLPTGASALANYVPVARTGNLLFVSGQIPLKDGKPAMIGKLGADLDVAAGYEAAKLCGIGVVAQIARALDGDLERVSRIVKVLGFVNATPEFGDQPKVVNGASDLFVAIFADRGRHARSAVGAASLPFGVAVEVEAIVEVG